MSYFVTSNDGTRIAFDRYGSGPAVVLVRGALEHRAIDLNTTNMARRLGELGFTVVDYDRRGRGESTDQAPYAVEREVEDLAALITDVGGEAFVFGHSAGAVLALYAAATEGVGVKKLALFEAPLVPGPGDGGASLRTLQAHLDENDREAAIAHFMRGAPEWLATAKHDPYWPNMLGVAHTLAYDMAIMAKPHERPWSEAFAQVTQPTVAMIGDPCEPFMETAADALVETLSHAEKRRVVARDHHWKPEPMAQSLRGWFTE